MSKKIGLLLTAVALVLGLAVVPAQLAAPDQLPAAEASLGHWCSHDARESHSWKDANGTYWQVRFRQHWQAPWNGGYRDRHQDNVSVSNTINGPWRWYKYDEHWC